MVKVEQIPVGGFDSNFSYLLYNEKSGDSAVVDPCGNTDLIKKKIMSLRKLFPKYVLLTHGHRDHFSGVDSVKSFFKAPVVAHPSCSFKHDIDVSDGQKLDFGDVFIECLYSPGHTNDSIIYHLADDSAVFTGDTLFIGCCGYCEPATMFKTMRQVIFPLADSNEVYSGHDYGCCPHGSLGGEKIKNPYLSAKTFEKFQEELKHL
ncbi:MAG: hydroxyacylglutathione hydrolase family protein [Victivallales bacterium]